MAADFQAKGGAAAALRPANDAWKRKNFFFEKKKQKTFANCGFWPGSRHNPQEMGVFLLLLLQKKKCFCGLGTGFKR